VTAMTQPTDTQTPKKLPKNNPNKSGKNTCLLLLNNKIAAKFFWSVKYNRKFTKPYNFAPLYQQEKRVRWVNSYPPSLQLSSA
jgi:hypothetical protein